LLLEGVQGQEDGSKLVELAEEDVDGLDLLGLVPLVNLDQSG